MAQEQTTLHETIVRDIIDSFDEVKDSAAPLMNIAKKARDNDFKSLSSKTAGLTLIFPMATSKNVDIHTASMAAKAQERQAVTMLQMLFSAINITSERDGFAFINQIHRNLHVPEFMDLNTFMDIADSLPYSESTLLTAEQFTRLKEDLRNLNFYFAEEYSEKSLNDYVVETTDRHGNVVIMESPIPSRKSLKDLPGDDYVPMVNVYDYIDSSTGEIDARAYADALDRRHNAVISTSRYMDEKKHNAAILKSQEDQRNIDKTIRDAENEYKKLRDDEKRELDLMKYRLDADKFDRDTAEIYRKAERDDFNDTRERITHQLVDNDVKKANELIPTLMVINYTKIELDGNGNGFPVRAQMLIGVKAKIYAIESNEIISRIINKNQDRNGLLQLVRATTREISFLSDFLFAIDRAKLDAYATARRGATAKIFKVLEKRANALKFRRRIGARNADVAAITTMHITKEEADLLKKVSGIDILKPNMVRGIMNAYNLMCFMVSDESAESLSVIYDTGEDFYEVMSFNSLERENADNSKKVINLISKLTR